MLIVGGGSVQDAVGFATATAHRGLRTVRMPTTVLAQNDSGIGVKNGVNAFGAKNFVGTFAPPFAVINDTAGAVTVVLDTRMLEVSPLNFHPLRNDRTTTIATADFLRFLDTVAHRPMILPFA